METNLSGQMLIAREFEDKELDGKNLQSAQLIACDLKEIEINGANMSLVDFAGSDLSDSKISNCNMSFSKTTDSTANGTTFTEINFSQLFPHTKIFDGCRGLSFIRCNLVNCDVPPDSYIEDCLLCHKDFCANLHPDWPLPKENDACRHVTNPNTLFDTLKEIAGIDTGDWEYEDLLVQ